MRPARAAWLGGFAALAWVMPWGVAQADTPPPPNPIVWIEPIADSGGAGMATGDGETLAHRFTKGLRAALEGEARNRFAVQIAPRRAAPMPTVPAAPTVRLVLRGGLSRVQDAGASPPYLCIVRLFREETAAPGAKTTRRLIGQWAGTALGLRDLTGNLVRDPRVHLLGLAGELSQRISAAALRFLSSGPAAATLGRHDTLDTHDGPPAVVVLDGGMAAPPAPPAPLPTSERQ